MGFLRIENPRSQPGQTSIRRIAVALLVIALAVSGASMLFLAFRPLKDYVHDIREGHTFTKTSIQTEKFSYSTPLDRTPMDPVEVWERVRFQLSTLAALGALALALAALIVARRFRLKTLLIVSVLAAAAGSVPAIAAGDRPERSPSARIAITFEKPLDPTHLDAMRKALKPEWIKLWATINTVSDGGTLELTEGQDIQTIEVSQEQGLATMRPNQLVCVIRMTPATTNEQTYVLAEVFFEKVERYAVGLAMDMGQKIPGSSYIPIKPESLMPQNTGDAGE